MAHIRTIQPHFAGSPSMRRISRDARLMFVLLWTIVDDSGRTWAVRSDLASVLYPSDFDAERYIEGWLDELENEGCIERYSVDDIDYLRVRHWNKHQQIDHPSPSYLPYSPNEQPDDSRIREASRKRRGKPRKLAQDQELGVRSCTIRENLEKEKQDDSPVIVTAQGVLRDLRRIQRNAEADRSYPSAVRTVELAAKIGLSSGGAVAAASGSSGPSPAILLGEDSNGG